MRIGGDRGAACAERIGPRTGNDECQECDDDSQPFSLLTPSRIAAAGDAIAAPANVNSDSQADILQALLALGYSDREAAASLKALPADVGVSEGIKLALRALAK